MITQHPSRFCHRAVVCTVLVLICMCQFKAFAFCGVNLNTIKAGTGRTGLGYPRGIITAKKAMMPESLGENNFVHRKKSPLVDDWLTFMDPDTPQDVVENKGNQFKHLVLEDISNEETRGLMEFLGFKRERHPKPKTLKYVRGFNFKKIGLGK